MTTRSRRSGGSAPKTTDEQAKAQAGEEPGAAGTDAQAAGGEGPNPLQLAEATGPQTAQGEPVPAAVEAGLVREETGLSPEPFAGGRPLTAATEFDPERNGKATAIPTDTSGELRKADAPPTAAHGEAENNGIVTGMDREGQLAREFGGNDTPGARLAGSGVRGEEGVGTLDPDLPADERVQYPSTTLTRSSSSAAPMEPEDVKRVTEPRLGVAETSTDPIAAAAVVQSHVGDKLVRLVDGAGNEVKPSEFFEVPDGPAARSLRRVKCRVSEVFTVRTVTSPGKRLLFTEGQEVPVHIAENLIELHG